MRFALFGIGYVMSLIALAAIILGVRDRLVRPRRLSAEEQQAAEAAWDARVLAPDWPAVEQRLGRQVPTVLRELYSDRELLMSAPLIVTGQLDGVESEWDIATFQPADAEATLVGQRGLPPIAFCFATTVFGDSYYLAIDRTGEDGPVYRNYHDGGDVVPVAESLREFLSWPRRPDRSIPGR